jgi:hypothetical protein
MLKGGYVEKTMETFALNVRSSARANLSRHNASKRLSNSIDFDLKVFPNSFAFEMFMEDYGEFLDKGVSGTKKKYNTPYSYTNKMPPTSAFDKWAVRRGLAGRNEKGQFLSRESLKFALAKSKFQKGQKPTHFFSDAIAKHFRDLPDDLIEAYGLDVEKLMEINLDAK